MKFYEDPTYIEMCRGAGEIQYFAPYHQGEYDLWVCRKCGELASAHRPGRGCGFWSGDWLPRLDQLIEMLLPDGDDCDGEAIHTLLLSLAGEFGFGIMQHDTMERLVLAFLMETKHGKKWDSKKKEWVKV